MHGTPQSVGTICRSLAGPSSDATAPARARAPTAAASAAAAAAISGLSFGGGASARQASTPYGVAPRAEGEAVPFIVAEEDRPYLERALALHAAAGAAPVIDGHNDLVWQLRGQFHGRLSKIDLREDHTRTKFDTTPGRLHTDVPRLRRGGLGAQFWSVYVPTRLGAEATAATLESVDVVLRLCESYPDVMELATCAADVRRIRAAGKVASLMGMEGGHSINCSLAVLRMFHRLGARYMSLTHNGHNEWADSCSGVRGGAIEPQHGGLSAFGLEVVREMNRLGMMVDLSHTAPDTMRAAISASAAPVLFSHSCCHAICAHPRNVPDDVLDLLPANGGVVMVTFVEDFVSGPVRLNPGGQATIAEVAAHVMHVVRRVGVQHVGLGGDLDGCPNLPVGLDDVACYPHLTAELLKQGLSEEEVLAVLGENVLRVMDGVEAVARELAAAPPSEVLVTDFPLPASSRFSDPGKMYPCKTDF